MPALRVDVPIVEEVVTPTYSEQLTWCDAATGEILAESDFFGSSTVSSLRLTVYSGRIYFPTAIGEGVDEKVFTGSFQFDEISPGWYPQLVLVNQSGLFEKSGVVVRVQPYGTSTLIETLNAAAESKLQSQT